MMEGEYGKLATADETARRMIHEALNLNLFVEASAGSGKTTALVERMTQMVLQGYAVSKICAITFTVAAANEFYERFQNALLEKINDPTLENTARQRCEEAFQNLDLCFMGTIDAFCNMVLHEHPVEAGIPSSAAVCTEAVRTAAYRREYLRVLDGEYGATLQQEAERLSTLVPNHAGFVVETLQKVLEHRDMTICCETEEVQFEASTETQLAQLIETLVWIAAHREYLYTGTKQSVEAFDALYQSLHTLQTEPMEHIGDVISILSKLKNLRLIVDPQTCGCAGRWFAFHSGKKSWYETTFFEKDGFYSQLKSVQYHMALGFLKHFSVAVSETLRKNGELDFFDYLLTLRNMLKKDAKGEGRLIQHIYNRHSYYLVDEFQDTNPLQAEILFYLCAREPNEEWHQCELRPGSLFIVGDPKQSIYRFRGADVSSFLRVKKLFQARESTGCYVVSLYQNFRSTANLCSWFNDTFTRLLSEESADQRAFERIPIQASIVETGLSGVWSYHTTQAAEEDAERVAKLIGSIVESNALSICEKNGRLRSVTYRDIMLISRTKTHLKKYLKIFAEHGIPVQMEGGTIFSESPALASLVSILNALVAPTDEVLVYDALSSGAFVITDADFRCWREMGQRLCIQAVRTSNPEMEAQPIATALEQLRVYAKLCQNVPISGVCETLLHDLKLLTRFGTDNLEYTIYAIELLRQAEIDGQVVGALESVAFLTSIAKDESEQERCLSLRREENRVHIANVHKVKGLEAPIVILIDPKASNRQNNHRTEYRDDQAKCFFFSLGESYNQISTAAFVEEEVREKASAEAETKRLLYVAATRAKNALIIAKPDKGNSNPWLPLLTDDLPDISEQLEQVNAVSETSVEMIHETAETKPYAEKPDACVFSNRDCVETYSYQIRKPSDKKLPEDYVEMDADNADNTLGKSLFLRQNATLAGTMIHDLFARIVLSGNSLDLEMVCTEISHSYVSEPASVQYFKETLCRAGNSFCNGGYPQENQGPQDLLGELLTAEEVYCEVPFALKNNVDGLDEVTYGIMDLVYRKNGKWYIVDYKTNADMHHLDDRYRDQLQSYRSALKQLLQVDAEARIYHVAL